MPESTAYHIEKVKLKDLESRFKSIRFKNPSIIPISSNRVQSYIHNPHSHPDDIVLYMMWDKGIMIAYRTLFSDLLSVRADKVSKFVWLSGSYTHPDYRRLGLSSRLLKEIYEDCNGMIMFTNAAPESAKLYDKSSFFETLTILHGHRYYLRSCLESILPPKKPIFRKMKSFFFVFDTMINTIFRVNHRSRVDIEEDSNIRLFNKWDINIMDFVDSFRTYGLYNRDEKIHQWIKKYPWIKSDEASKYESDIYNFSTYATDFESLNYKILGDKQQIVAIIQLTIRDHQLSIPYAYIKKESRQQVLQVLAFVIRKYKIVYLTNYHPEIEEILINNRGLYLIKKDFYQKFMVSKELLNRHPWIKDKLIQSGDGDKVFV